MEEIKKDSNKEYDYRNMPNLDDDSEENIKKVDDMMEFFYNKELEKKKKD